MSNTIKPYKPIDCSFYDRLEEAITLKTEVILEIEQEGKIRQLNTTLIDLFIESKIEWLMTGIGEKVRLDHIQSINGIALEKAC